MSTLKSVAARCGVDISTASRALRSDPRVKEETRLKVLKAAEELQYSPNLAARNLVKGRSRTLALITSSLVNPLEQMPAQYASSYLQEKSYDLMISLSGGSGETYERLLSRLEQNIFDGAIIIPGSPLTGEAENIFHRLEERGFPLVFLDRWDRRLSFPVVTTDNRQAGAQLSELLLNRGCRNILILKEYVNVVEEDRMAGELETCRKRGVSVHIIDMNQEKESLNLTGLTGVITTSSSLLHRFTLKYQDVLEGKTLYFGVFDEWAGSPYPAKEVIICHQDFQRMAHKACELILDKLEKKGEMKSHYFIHPLEYITLSR